MDFVSSLTQAAHSHQTMIDMPDYHTCHFYQKAWYGGSVYTASVSPWIGAKNIFTLDGWWDNTVSSVICGRNVLVYLCDHGPNDDCMNGHGFSLAGTYNGDMGSSLNGHGDSASTVKMYYWDPVTDYGGVTVVQDRDCVDDSAYLPAGKIGETMYYTWDDLVHHNFHKYELDSLMIPIGYEATIYYYDGFTGR